MMVLAKMCILIFGFTLKQKYRANKGFDSAKKINVMLKKQVPTSDSLFDELVLVKGTCLNVAKKIAGKKHLLNKNGSRCFKNLKKKHTHFKPSKAGRIYILLAWYISFR